MLNHDLVSQASRRAMITGTTFSASMKRAAANWQRRQLNGQYASTGGFPPIKSPVAEIPVPTPPMAEVDLPEPGANIPDLPAPVVEAPGAPEPVAESAAAVVQDPMPIPGDEPAEDPELAKKTKNIGRAVTWTAMGVTHEGTIGYVIPAGKTPGDLGIPAGAKAKARDHISYVIEKEGGALSWPVVKGLSIKK